MNWRARIEEVKIGDQVLVTRPHIRCNDSECCNTHYVGKIVTVRGILQLNNTYKLDNGTGDHCVGFTRECFEKVL